MEKKNLVELKTRLQWYENKLQYLSESVLVMTIREVVYDRPEPYVDIFKTRFRQWLKVYDNVLLMQYGYQISTNCYDIFETIKR